MDTTLTTLRPLGQVDRADMVTDARLDGLDGKRIGFVWDYVFRGDEMFPLIEAEIRRHHPDATFVPFETFGNIHGKESDPVLDQLAAKLREQQVDAVVVGVGNCGSCTPAVVRGALIAERAGMPSVALVSSGFKNQAEAVARAYGLSDLSLAVYPGVIPFDSREQLEEKIRDTVAPAVMEGFTRPLAADETAPATGDWSTPAFVGDYDEVQEYFHAQGWTDGLPITPPTPERVEAFLDFTDRDPDEVLGVLPPAYRQATVRAVAINGVMAGCRPEYMPLLVAAVEAIADPGFQLQHAGATPGWEPIVMVSGRIAKTLGFYSGTGALRVGHRANTSLGRFVRMCFRNLAGWIPGETDKGTLGSGFNVAVAEDEDAVAALGWQPLRVDRGFCADDDVVTVMSELVTSIPTYSGGTTPEELMGPLRRSMLEAIGPWSYTTLWYGQSHQLIVMSPAVAGAFASHGWTKDDIRRDLVEHVTIPARDIEDYPLHAAGQRWPLERLVADGDIDASYVEDSDPGRPIRILLGPEFINIAIAGDPGRNQSRIVFNNHEQGPATSRRVELPAAWEEKLGAAVQAAA